VGSHELQRSQVPVQFVAVANACLLRSALAEQAAQLIDGRPLKTDSHMAVDVKSHTDCTVPKQFLNDLRVFASFLSPSHDPVQNECQWARRVCGLGQLP